MSVKFNLRGLIACGLIAYVALVAVPGISGASALSAWSVPGLYHCSPSLSCHLRSANLHFVNYSSVCFRSDCNFVAAADWEKIALGVQPSVKEVSGDYYAAHQTFHGGLHMPDLWSYWKQDGIDGAYATKVSVWLHSQGAVQNGVNKYGALITELRVTKLSPLGRQLGTNGLILAIVDGFDPLGPLIVFQSRTIQSTWAQWNTSVRAVWEVTTSSAPPLPPSTITTTSTVPPTTTTTLAPTASVTFDANGGSGLMATETEVVNTAASLSPNAFTFYGYTFNNWNTDPNGTGSSFANGAVYSFATSITLYAQWTAMTPTPFAGMTSTNWSGYVFESSSILTETSGRWIVPTLNCADTANAESSTWVGIGGFEWSTGGSSGSLLQTGTDDACVNGVQQDYGWWELVPSTPNNSVQFSNFAISPGDSMEGDVFQDSSGAWVTELKDMTTGLQGTMISGEGWGVAPIGAKFTNQGSTSGLTYSGGYTAEWIVEDNTNSQSNSYNPFANYGSVAFSNITTDQASWSLAPSDAEEIVQSGVVLSVPSPIVNGGFTVTYTGP